MFSPKHMGICQKRAVGVNCEGKHIMMSIKSTKHTTKPCKMAKKAHVKRAASVAKEVQLIIRRNLQVSKGSYRPSLEALAVARYNVLDKVVLWLVGDQQALRRAH